MDFSFDLDWYKRGKNMSKVLEVKSLKKKYKNFALKDVSFSLEKGTITGFIGENGAGKTTIFSSIAFPFHA